MRALAAPALLLCMTMQGAGTGRSLLTAWTAPPLRQAKICPSATRTASSTSWTATAATQARARERVVAAGAGAGASAGDPLRSKSRGGADLPTGAVSALLSDAPAGAPQPAGKQSLFIFGIGYVATAIALTYLRKGWTVHGTCTDPRKVKSLGDQGIKAFIFDDWSGPMMQTEPLEVLASATCVLSTVPPALQSGTDPVLVAHEAELKWAHSNGNLRWVGYLSSTGVYGDRGGGWVTEEDEPWPAAPRTKARLKAERSWLRLHERHGVPSHVFRLAGIYGPGRSALDAVARHSGDIRLAGSDDGTMVSRIHVCDIVGVLEASIERPCPGVVMNVADDLPSTRYETLAYGCKLLGFPRQDPDPGEKYVNRRGGGNKRVDNGKMRALLAASGRRLIFPDYRVGLKALHEGDGRPFTEPTEEAAASGTATAAAAAAATSCTGVVGGGEGTGETSMAEELRALTAQVSRLEASLERVLAVLPSVAAGDVDGDGHGEVAETANTSSPAGAGAWKGDNSGEVVIDSRGSSSISRGEEASEGDVDVDIDVLPDGMKQLAVDADSS
eukprot:g7329.t1